MITLLSYIFTIVVSVTMILVCIGISAFAIKIIKNIIKGK